MTLHMNLLHLQVIKHLLCFSVSSHIIMLLAAVVVVPDAELGFVAEIVVGVKMLIFFVYSRAVDLVAFRFQLLKF